MEDLISRARKFATSAHQHIQHRRKYTEQPYEVHLKAVARLVAEVTNDARLVAAAWLHDTVEDTLATHTDIEAEFGEEIAILVYQLTDISRPGDGNRATRKAIDREHLARASAGAQTVKLADLIDNTADICRHDEKFGRIFLVEARQLLEVLHKGDARLFARAQQVISHYAEKLGITEVDGIPPELAADEDWFPGSRPGEKRIVRFFTQAFVAEDIAEPLRSFDGTRRVEDVISLMELQDLEVAGIRQGGAVVAAVRRCDLNGATDLLDDLARLISRDQIVSGDSPLSEVGMVLSRHQYCFVRVLGSIGGVISRSDFDKPLVRMWLFGIITIIEMALTERIRQLWPDESWTALLSEARLEQAGQLREERIRRQQHCDLLDCLQMGDKGRIMLSDQALLAEFGLPTQRIAKRAIKQIESLRNNLAHGQSIVTHDWAQILRFARNAANFNKLIGLNEMNFR